MEQAAALERRWFDTLRDGSVCWGDGNAAMAGLEEQADAAFAALKAEVRSAPSACAWHHAEQNVARALTKARASLEISRGGSWDDEASWIAQRTGLDQLQGVRATLEVAAAKRAKLRRDISDRLAGAGEGARLELEAERRCREERMQGLHELVVRLQQSIPPS